MQEVFEKIFKDPLYDYIYIDNDICDKIIDSAYFQRLRRIEQTSMRCLYPSARHDRFIHSIGVYHLAKIAIEALTTNPLACIDVDKEDISLPDDTLKENLKFSFKLAALLHDVGHSPFSHTLEDYFEKKYEVDENGNVDLGTRIIDRFIESAKKVVRSNNGKVFEEFNGFQEDCTRANAAVHEIVSCILIFEKFIPIIEELAQRRGFEVDYFFMARCILGATYSDLDNFNDYKNCIIKLLNSDIDVDKLDYISRDSSISGFANTMVDTKRLLSSVMLAAYKDDNNKIKLCLSFRKTAVGIIQNVVIARNSLYTWVYSHHKVAYESYLIKKAVELIAQKNGDTNLFKSRYFTVDKIIEELICDDVIWSLFLKYKDIPEVNEIIQRNSQKKAIWKSYAEFQGYFNSSSGILSVGDFSIKEMRNALEAMGEDRDKEVDFRNYLNSFDKDMQFEIVLNKPKLTYIGHNKILIYLNNKLYSFDEIFSDVYKKSEIATYFYIYCNKSAKDLLNQDKNATNGKNKLIEYIKKYDKFRMKPGGK